MRDILHGLACPDRFLFQVSSFIAYGFGDMIKSKVMTKITR
jgi:hypothetical protein